MRDRLKYIERERKIVRHGEGEKQKEIGRKKEKEEKRREEVRRDKK